MTYKPMEIPEYKEEYDKEKRRLQVAKAKEDAAKDFNKKPMIVRVINKILEIIKS